MHGPVTAQPRERERNSPPPRLAIALAALAVAIVMGGTLGLILDHDSATPASNGSSAASDVAGLSLWALFPVDAAPRPLVLTGPAIIDPRGGFSSGNDKSAYVSGSFELATALPTGPATIAGQPIITAGDAFALLRTSATGGSKGPVRSSLKVTAARLGTATFSTDRGSRTLPAWEFTLAGVAEPASVLAIPASDRWPRAGMPTYAPPSERATVSTDGRHVTIHFVGANPGSGPCDAEYAPQLTQSSTAVALSARRLPNPQATPNTGCWLIGYDRTVTVALTRPLGNRVLIDPAGAPIPLT